MSGIPSLSCFVLAQLPRICSICFLPLHFENAHFPLRALDSNVMLCFFAKYHIVDSGCLWHILVYKRLWINADYESEIMAAFCPRRLTHAHPPGVLACSPVGQGRSRVALAT